MTITDKTIPVNNYNRPGVKQVPKRICVHYTGCAGSGAAALAKYFENVAKGVFKDNSSAWTSSQYVVGMLGEVVRIIPDKEIAYGASGKNQDVIHIEVCHADAGGEFSEAAVKALGELVRSLMSKYSIPAERVVRHYDLTGKHCPLYYVDSKRWAALHKQITAAPRKLYRVQVGAFSDPKNAENYAAKIRKKGFNAFIVEEEIYG